MTKQERDVSGRLEFLSAHALARHKNHWNYFTEPLYGNEYKRRHDLFINLNEKVEEMRANGRGNGTSPALSESLRDLGFTDTENNGLVDFLQGQDAYLRTLTPAQILDKEIAREVLRITGIDDVCVSTNEHDIRTHLSRFDNTIDTFPEWRTTPLVAEEIHRRQRFRADLARMLADIRAHSDPVVQAPRASLLYEQLHGLDMRASERVQEFILERVPALRGDFRWNENVERDIVRLSH